MIQSILFFALGFLCAGFLVLTIAPAVWRRAVALMRKRIEASMPLSLSEIQADKDRMRAEFAMSMRRLEMTIKSLRDKATAEAVEMNRKREELKRVAAQLAERDLALSEIEGKGGDLRNELRRREDEVRQLADRLSEAEQLLEERALEFDKIGRMYDEAALVAGNRQIELVARETEIDRLAAEVSLVRSERQEIEQRMREAAAESRAAHEALKAEKKKVDDLEKKAERLMTALADREEKLDRRERELARLRAPDTSAPDTARAKKRDSAEAGSLRLPLAGAKGEDIDKAVAKLEGDRDRLEARLTTLARENRKLRTDLAANARPESNDRNREDALLREQINDLAAEMVSMTVALEGPDSPISKALAMPAPQASLDAGGKITSLADRVKALQKAASES